MSIERKLRKRARKLAKFARKHGLEYVHIGAMAPDEFTSEWFADVTAHGEHGTNNVSVGDFFKEAEL